MRFSALQRLRLSREIRAVREQGRRIDAGAFTLWWLGREQSGLPSPARACVIASTAALGGAVRRVRAKRRLREVFRRHQTLVPGGLDLLLIARRDVLRLGWSELEQRFAEACKRLPVKHNA